MNKLRISPKVELLTLNDLETLEKNIDKIVNPSSIKLTSKFKRIIQYNKELIQGEVIYDINDKINETDISRDNRSKFNIKLSKYQTSTIYKVELTSEFELKKELKLNLNDLYNEFYDKVEPTFIKEFGSISYINIFDTYQLKEEKDSFFDKILNNNLLKETLSEIIEPSKLKTKNTTFPIRQDINNKLSQAGIYAKKEYNTINEKTKKYLKPAHIYIISCFNTLKSHILYKKIYSYNDKINIKYLPYTKNTYNPSLFYILIRYRAGKGTLYKNIVLYIETETNWAVATITSDNDFSSQFYDLLHTRFDTRYNNMNLIDFRPDNSHNSFNKEINSIFLEMNNILENKSKTLSFDNIFKKINTLKVNYPKTNYGFRLIKNIISYIRIVKKIESEKDVLFETKKIINKMLNENIYEKINEIFKSILVRNKIYDNIDIEKLRLGVILRIKDKSICDIFDELLWTKEEDIITSLEIIKNDKDKLKLLFLEIGINIIYDLNDMQNKFDEIILPKIIKGEKIDFFEEF